MDSLFFAGVVLLLIVLFMGQEYINSTKFRKQMLQKLYQSYGKESERTYGPEEMAHICMYYNKHRVEDQLDDITWNDLHLDQIYQRMNTSCSAAGDEYLYYRLRTPVYDADEMEDMEKRICFFMEHELERQYENLDLTKEQRKLVNDYIACTLSSNQRYADISYMCGIKDTVSILVSLGLIKCVEADE